MQTLVWRCAALFATDLRRRVVAHRNGDGGKFTQRSSVFTLVWFEHHRDITTAIQREKSLKRWPRDWKKNLIERENLHWQDLFPTLVEGASFRDA